MLSIICDSVIAVQDASQNTSITPTTLGLGLAIRSH